jgi:hypothetical protein
MSVKEPDYEELTRALIASFTVLADEVQHLSDRKTILEHKLRFAHEQVSIAILLLLAQAITRDPSSYDEKL